MEWIEIKSEKDIIELMEYYFNFHDSCIKKIDYATGLRVNEENDMNVYTKDGFIKILFQTQWEKGDIELMFEGIEDVRINFIPKWGGNIYGALLTINNNILCWADDSEFNIDDPNKNLDTTFVKCKKVKYRKINK